MTWDAVQFETTIGVDVKGDVWSCVAIPDSAELFGSGRSTRVDATIDDVVLANVGAVPTGTGRHMVSISAKVRKQLGKDVGDAVTVRIAPPA
ncbi:DUF1905 domain-containing protein [Agrococcus jejuensis]|uniref:DUF1905 domain-containing protein n=1 Tax=Agrococcus jejuensis TaxID=399736 RepID=A0A1G8CEQ4_9MICO|nr:DUF1905 domain-containing protein [Agrococcus jejuensis]SDH43838.1 protein of unknown function [Agrococcus jejuensis]